MGEAAARRLFFALWPQPGVRDALAEVAQATVDEGARAVPATRLHLTLAFLGQLRPSAVQQALDVAEGVQGRPFRLQLDRLGYFYRRRILWLGPTQPPQALLALARDLRSDLIEAGLELERHRFAPHITLARRAPPPAKDLKPGPVSWPVQSYCLMESVQRESGRRYEVIETWPLRPAG